MKRSKNWILTISLSCFLTAGQFGCSVTPKTAPGSNLSSIFETKTVHLHVAIVPSDEIPTIDCVTFDTGRGRAASEIAGKAAKKGAVVGALLPIYAVGEDPRAVILFPLWPILIPAGAIGGAVFGGIGGAITGSIKGDYREFPMEQADEVKKLAAYAFTVSNINKVLAEDLMKAGQALTDYKYTVSTQDDFDMDTDIVLRAGISHLEFRGENEKDPDTRLKVQVEVIVEDAKSTNRYSKSFDYVSKEYDLSEWLDKNGKLLQQEYKNCYRSLSTNIIKEMFITNEYYIEGLLTPKTPYVPVTTEQKPTPLDSGYHLAYAPETKETVGPLLRNKPATKLKETTIKTMLYRYDFFHSQLNPDGSFDNEFIDNIKGTITDKATGLMWQKSGSPRSLNYRQANKYIEQLNKESFAGFSDWRMPTVEELASLLKKEKLNNVHIDSVFNSQQTRCWSIDQAPHMHGGSGKNTSTTWIVDYKSGKTIRAYWWHGHEPGWASQYIRLPDNYVRAVRSVKQ